MKSSPLRQTICSLGLLALALGPLVCYGWGNDGHQVVGGIAVRLLQGTPTEKRLQALLLPGETLTTVTLWADCAKGKTYCGVEPTPEMKAFTKANPDHHGYHYTDIAIEAPHYDVTLPGANDHDIVQTLNQAVAALQGKSGAPENPHNFTPRQAMLLLAHLVGDVHQPMHVGAVYLTDAGEIKTPEGASLSNGMLHATEGGNMLHINGSGHVLHSYWDTDAVKRLMSKKKVKTADALAETLYQADPEPMVLDKNLQKEIDGWADESIRAAQVAFQGVGFEPMRHDFPGRAPDGWSISLPKGYSATAAQVAGDRLTLAGKRLAALLQATFR